MFRLQRALPERYTSATPDELEGWIAAAKAALGRRLLILGHHYQRDDVMRWADARGDSFGLSRIAADRQDAEFIVFCGVHFMAESADILTADHQQVCLPDLNAGCSMADMADLDSVEEAWESLGEVTDVERIVPVTYMNSSALLKAFVGRHGGAVCTSSNARAVLTWALVGDGAGGPRGDKVLFFPDQHLGRNTGFQLGYGAEDMRVWNPRLDAGGLADADVKAASLLLWKGHCSVHQRFRPEHVAAFREQYPDGIVLVHPECAHEVAELADEVGSTDHIIRAVGRRPGGRGDRGRHRDPPGEAARRRGARQDGGLPRSARVPVLDHVADRCPSSGLGARRAGGGRGPQPHNGRGRDGAMGQGGARPDARHHLRRPRPSCRGAYNAPLPEEERGAE